MGNNRKKYTTVFNLNYYLTFMKKRYLIPWLSYAVGGLLATGLGLSLFGEALSAKQRKKSWFWRGTLSLVVFNAGLSLVGTSVVHRVRGLLDQ